MFSLPSPLSFRKVPNSSVRRGSDRRSEGRRFKPDLVDIKTLLTHLVECQPHELKAIGSIPTRGTSCF